MEEFKLASCQMNVVDDKEKNIEKAKARKEAMKDITLGAMVLTITSTAVTLAAKGVLSVYNAIKHN